MAEEKQKKAPLVSVVLPTYNRSALLRRAIESVARQSFKDWELVVVDDASSDDTPRVLAEMKAKDNRIVVIRNETNYYPDISRTLNKGMAVAKAPLIARLDDDDYWIDDDKLKKQYEFLTAHPEYVVVGGGMITVSPEGKELQRYFKKETDGAIRKGALYANPFLHTTVMFRKDVARERGGYGNWRFAEDWDLWLKMGTRGKFYNFPQYFTAYTVTGGNKSFVYQRPQSRMIMQFAVIHRREYPGFLGAYLVNGLQYLYSFLPVSFRRALHATLTALKRKIF